MNNNIGIGGRFGVKLKILRHQWPNISKQVKIRGFGNICLRLLVVTFLSCAWKSVSIFHLQSPLLETAHFFHWSSYWVYSTRGWNKFTGIFTQRKPRGGGGKWKITLSQLARKNQLIFRSSGLLNFSRADVLLFPFFVQERGAQKRRNNFFYPKANRSSW